MPQVRSANATPEAGPGCGCDWQKLRTVHAYLKAQFPGFLLGDFHAPTRLTRLGGTGEHDHHHVVSLTQGDVLPYYAVLLNEFQQYSVAEIAEFLHHWDLAGTLRASRIAIASRQGVSSL